MSKIRDRADRISKRTMMRRDMLDQIVEMAKKRGFDENTVIEAMEIEFATNYSDNEIYRMGFREDYRDGFRDGFKDINPS